MSEPQHLRLIAGLQPVREVLRVHGSRVDKVIIDCRPIARLDAIESFARAQGVRQVQRVPGSLLDRLACGVQHQGVVAWAPLLQMTPLSSILADPDLLAPFLDGVQDPQNFGATVRSAVAIARAAVVWGQHASAPLSPATFRASAGAVEHARLCCVPSLRNALQQASQAGALIIGLDAQADTALQNVATAGPTVLVLGSEHRGLGRGVRSQCHRTARLISSGTIDSLNVSVAAGIALHTVLVSRANSDR
jgi:23S rRNA (guanosine2251-2'-O)-methyltransferase